jgi:hypothetical protein
MAAGWCSMLEPEISDALKKLAERRVWGHPFLPYGAGLGRCCYFLPSIA